MTKHSKYENDRRAAESVRMKEIEAAWMGSLPTETAKAFKTAVDSARSRPPAEPPANMAPGTLPRPPKREPRPTKEERTRRPPRD